MPVMGASRTVECSSGVEVFPPSNLVAPVSTPVLCILIFSVYISSYLTHIILRVNGGTRRSLESQTKTRLNPEFVSQFFLVRRTLGHRARFTVALAILNVDRAIFRSISPLTPCCRRLQWPK